VSASTSPRIPKSVATPRTAESHSGRLQIAARSITEATEPFRCCWTNRVRTADEIQKRLQENFDRVLEEARRIRAEIEDRLRKLRRGGQGDHTDRTRKKTRQSSRSVASDGKKVTAGVGERSTCRRRREWEGFSPSPKFDV
jgi:hypothetical protein